MQIPIRSAGRSWNNPGPVIAYAEIDASDETELSQYRWHLSPSGYAIRTDQPPAATVCPECGWLPRPGVRVANSVASHRSKMHKVRGVRRYDILMHRQLLGLAPGDRRQGDHINRDRLDNRRSNLRVTPGSIQTQNQGALKAINGKPVESAYRGVYMVKKKGKWTGRWKACAAGKYLGCFASEVEAAKVAADYRRETMPYATD